MSRRSTRISSATTVSGPSTDSSSGSITSRSLKNGAAAKSARAPPRDFDDIMADSDEDQTNVGNLTNDATFQHERMRKSSAGDGAAAAGAAGTSGKAKAVRGAKLSAKAEQGKDAGKGTRPGNAKRKAQDEVLVSSAAASAKRSNATRDNGRTRAPRKSESFLLVAARVCLEKQDCPRQLCSAGQIR